MNLEGQNFDQYEGLLVSMEANTRKLNLLIGVCDDSQLRDEIIAQYETEVEEGIVCYRITLQPQKPSIRFLLEDLIAQNPQIKDQDRVVVTVLGADQLRFLEFEEGKRSEVEEFAGYMQWTREGLRRFPFSIVIWVTTNVENALKQKAPDFWSWRKGVFRFESKPREFVRKADLESIREMFGQNFQAESTTLIPIDDLQELIRKIEAKDPKDTRLPSLYDSVGRSYRKRCESGEYRDYQQEARKAIAYFEKALDFSEQDPLDEAYRLNELGYINNFLGHYAEAEPLFRRSLSIREKQLGSDHPDVANSLNNLAGLYDSQGKYAEAEPLYRRSLSIREKQLGSDHPDVATSLNNLAGLYDSQGKYAEAEPLYRRSLSIREKQLGSDHPDVANSLNNLAGLYYSQGKYAEAEPLYRRSLSIDEKALGSDHPYVATDLNNLALLYKTQGKYAEAEPLYRRSLSIREKVLGSDHPDVANSLNNLAELYRVQGKYAEAEPLYRRSLSIREKQLGSDHPSVANSLNNLAVLYDAQGKYAEAEPLYRRSLSIREKQLGSDHPDVAQSLNNLAWLYRDQEQYEKSLPLYERAFEIRSKVLGENHPNTKDVKVSIEIVRQKILG
jgi:tetratricopeptide (TPR) repeat protein